MMPAFPSRPQRRAPNCLLAAAMTALLGLALLAPVPAGAYRLGINADNWSGQVTYPAFEESVLAMGVEFIVWHLSPAEEDSLPALMEIVAFSRAHGIAYAFNTELMNYLPDYAAFRQEDGTYRWDLKPETMALLADDPLFLGVVYDEPMLMQQLNGFEPQPGNRIAPYFAQTRGSTIQAAHQAVVSKIRELADYYGGYGKRLVFEMVFPTYAHPAARGGAVLAPKLLKENFNDLMYATFASAAHQYGQPELWACIDLWFWDRFPTEGYYAEGFHTPDELSETLLYTYRKGFDYVYVEQAKGLMDASFRLTDFGRRVAEFQAARRAEKAGDWRKPRVDFLIRHFPDGYWGQEYGLYVPDHPYGSWRKSPNDDLRHRLYLGALHDLSAGGIPAGADTWNAIYLPFFAVTPYTTMAGLPEVYIADQYLRLPLIANATRQTPQVSGIELMDNANVLDIPQPTRNGGSAIPLLLLTPGQ